MRAARTATVAAAGHLAGPRAPGKHLLVSVRFPGADGRRRSAARSPPGVPAMSALAPTLQAFFTDRLIPQRHASHNTIAAYRDTLRLLLGFASPRPRIPPSPLDIADLDAPPLPRLL